MNGAQLISFRETARGKANSVAIFERDRKTSFGQQQTLPIQLSNDIP